jgi:mRNA-degrading endonuclease RelE of RelBE toxin-antitoxin system
VYKVRYSTVARRQLRDLRAYDARRIVGEIDSLAEHDEPAEHPGVKKVRGIKPPWGGKEPIFQLRVGDFRVFFDVAADELLVNAVRRKGRKTTKEAL